MTAEQAFQKALALSRNYVKETAEGLGAVKGKDGKDGATPTIGLDGNWYIDDVDTGVKAVGEDGITPHIDPTTKHWIIGETDTGILAEGTNGTDGTDGVDGTDGFSPTIEVKTQTATEYVLSITDKNGSFDTPNLKGKDGSGTEVDLSGYAKKEDVPTKTSELENDSGFLNAIPSEYVTETKMQEYAQPLGDYATNTDLQSYSLISDTGNEIALSIDPVNYIMTLQLKNANGDVLSEKTIDFPLESMVVNATYNAGVITFTLQNGTTFEANISAIVNGLVNDTFTIAGIDMKDDITSQELRAALSISNVENKSGATIRSEMTKEEVVNALGYTPQKYKETQTASVSIDSENDALVITYKE